MLEDGRGILGSDAMESSPGREARDSDWLNQMRLIKPQEESRVNRSSWPRNDLPDDTGSSGGILYQMRDCVPNSVVVWMEPNFDGPNHGSQHLAPWSVHVVHPLVSLASQEWGGCSTRRLLAEVRPRTLSL